MSGRLPYQQWLALMAEALGMDKAEFAGLSNADRRDLLAAASGLDYEAFKSLPDSVAQVEAIRKHSGGQDWHVKRNEDKLPPKEAKGKSKAENGEEGDDGETKTEAQAEGEGDGEGEGQACGAPQEDDPAVKLSGLNSFLAPYVQAIVDKALAEGGGGSRNGYFEVKLPEMDSIKIEGHAHPKFGEVLTLAALGLPVMLVGPAGTGKTTLGRQVAEALQRPFGSVSCTAGMSEGELVGKLLPNENGGFEYRPSQFVTLYENGGVYLVDEIDAADPNVLLKVNQSIGSVAGGGLWHNDLRHKSPEVRQHKEFVLIAAANTFGTGAGAQYVGRNQLDAATLDRFAVVEIDYDVDFEGKIGDAETCKWLWSIRKKANEARLRRVVSTRAIQRCTMMKAAGMKQDAIKRMFFASWSQDERAKVEA